MVCPDSLHCMMVVSPSNGDYQDISFIWSVAQIQVTLLSVHTASGNKTQPDRGTTPLDAQGGNKRNEPDNTADVITERLRKLESDLREKEKIIQQLAEQQDRRSSGLSMSSNLTTPPNSSPNNSLPNRDSASPVKGQYISGSSASLLGNNDAASSGESSASTSGEQTRLRVHESRNRRNSSRRSRSITMSKSFNDDSKPLMETDAQPENGEWNMAHFFLHKGSGEINQSAVKTDEICLPKLSLKYMF